MTFALLAKRQNDVAAMFDDVAERYDATNGLMSLGLERYWRRATVRAVGARPGMTVLDLAAGTGSSTEPLDAAGARVIACDLSTGMLQVGHARRPDLAFIGGDALSLPFADDSFDAVTISFGLRNVPDVPAALQEMLRVTRPGGRLVICELSTPVRPSLRRGRDLFLDRILPIGIRAAARAEYAYKYLAASIQGWADQPTLASFMEYAGWSDVSYRNLNGGIVAVHQGTCPR